MTRGFTLLEVSVALAILAIGLVSVVDINTGAARLHEQSKHLTLATLLAKGKMIDLEQKLNEDGFSDFDQQIDGTFDEQGHPEIRWHAEILKPDTTKANDQLTQLITGAMGGGSPGSPGSGSTDGQSGGATGPLASFLSQSSLIPSASSLPSGLSSLLPSSAPTDPNAPSSPVATGLGGVLGGAATTIIQAQVTQLVTLIQNGVREVRLTVAWPDGKREDNISIATHFVILRPSGTGVSTGLPPGQGSPNSLGSASGTPGANGVTVPGGAGGASSPGGGGLTMPGSQGGLTTPGSIFGAPQTGLPSGQLIRQGGP
jgi:general secretion pathway protein I